VPSGEFAWCPDIGHIRGENQQPCRLHVSLQYEDYNPLGLCPALAMAIDCLLTLLLETFMNASGTQFKIEAEKGKTVTQ